MKVERIPKEKGTVHNNLSKVPLRVVNIDWFRGIHTTAVYEMKEFIAGRFKVNIIHYIPKCSKRVYTRKM